MESKYIIVVLIIITIIGIGIAGYSIYNNEQKQNIADNTIENSTYNETTTSNTTESITNNTNTEKIEEEKSMYNTGKHHAEIVVKDYGTIALELDADIAPITVANFAKLANEGFYDGLTFHRIIEGFMIQGGDPLGNGTGGSKENIKGEFSLNGIKNSISHVRGTISMARSQAYNSASSQFFIVHEDSTFLDGKYAGFGKVTSGIEIVDKICEDIQVEDNNGTVLKKNQPTIEKITMID